MVLVFSLWLAYGISLFCSKVTQCQKVYTMTMKQKEEVWYQGYWSDKPVQDAVKFALQSYQKKFGTPPSEILVSLEQSDLQPMEGFSFVVKVDPYVTINTFLLGVIDDETKEICLGVKAG